MTPSSGRAALASLLLCCALAFWLRARPHPALARHAPTTPGSVTIPIPPPDDEACLEDESWLP
jgi:hypothetical protein